MRLDTERLIMQEVNIEKSVLLPIVISNREKHNQIYNAAVSGYWIKAEEVLNSKITQIQKQEKIDNYLNLSFPENHEEDYNRVIQMVELSSDAILNLSQTEFSQYVRNNWNWRQSFLGTNSNYITGSAFIGCSGMLAKF